MRSHWQSQVSGLPHTVSEVMKNRSKGQSDWMELVTSEEDEGQSGLLWPGSRNEGGLLVWGLAA